jgi:hypothetical protein
MICGPAVTIALAAGMFSNVHLATNSRTFRLSFTIWFLRFLPAVLGQRGAKRPHDAPFRRCNLARSQFGNRLTLSRVKRQATVKEHVLRHHDQRFAVVSVLLQMKVLERARMPLETGGDRAACGHEQAFAGHRQISLGRYTAFGFRSRMRLGHVEPAGLAVLPDDIARGGVQGVQENPFGGPDAGREIDGVFHDDRSAASGPARDDRVIAQHTAVIGTTSKSPQQLAITQANRVQISVIAGHKRSILPDGRSKADRALGEILPTH